LADPPVLTSVRPVFKLKKGEATELAADRYLYAINLGAMTKMVKGGDYFLGKDGKPYYPKNKTKPKPIPVAKYFFYSGTAALTKAKIEKLTREDCHEAVTLTRDPKQEVILKAAVPEYAFIVGRRGFYSGAYKYFLWGQRFPKDWITKPKGKKKRLTLEEIFTEIYGLSEPYRDIHIASHANEFSWLGFFLRLLKEVKVKGHLVEKLVRRRVTYYSLKEKLEQGGLDDLSGKLGADKRVFIRGCNIGQNTAMLDLLKKAFGGNCTVYAPTHKQTFYWKQRGSKKRTWEYFHTYWMRYAGVIKKSRKQLIIEFKAKYPQVKPKLWRRYIRKVKRKVISLPTNWLIVLRHPSNLKKKPCLRFAKKYWKRYFKANKQWPSEFIRREGPRDAVTKEGETFSAYWYYFKGKFYSKDDKAWVKGSFSLPLEAPPNAAEILKTEKARHPHPDWYDWKMTYKNKGRLVRIQPKGRMTIYQIRKPIIDATGKHLKADISDSQYWGKSS
jgi:hypothetical protein